MSAADPSAAEHEALRAAITAARAKAEALAEARRRPPGRRGAGRGGAGGPVPDAADADDGEAESADAPTEVAAGDLTVTRHPRLVRRSRSAERRLSDVRLIFSVQAVRAFLYGFSSILIGSSLAAPGPRRDHGRR